MSDRIKTCTGLGAFMLASWAMFLAIGAGIGAHWMAGDMKGVSGKASEFVEEGGLYKLDRSRNYELTITRSGCAVDVRSVWSQDGFPIGKYFTIIKGTPVVVERY